MKEGFIRYCKHFTTALLVVALLFTCIPLYGAAADGLGQAAPPADQSAGLIFEINEGKFYVDSDRTGIISPAKELTGYADNWSWNVSTKTLTLNNFIWETTAPVALLITDNLNHSPQTADELTLRLGSGISYFTVKGAHSNESSRGISCVNVNLKITCDAGVRAGLAVTSGDVSSPTLPQEYSTTGISVWKLAVQNAAVRVKAGSSGGFTTGIDCVDFTMSGGIVSVEAGSSQTRDSRGISTVSITAGGGSLDVRCDGTPGPGSGIMCEEYNYRGGTVNIFGNTRPIYSAADNIIIDPSVLPYTLKYDNINGRFNAAENTVTINSTGAPPYINDYKHIVMSQGTAEGALALAESATVTGIAENALPAGQQATLQLYLDTFKSNWNGGNVSSWFNNLPTGIAVTADSAAKDRLTFSFSGTPLTPSAQAFSITIPAGELTGGTALTVAPNPNAAFAIAAALPQYTMLRDSYSFPNAAGSFGYPANYYIPEARYVALYGPSSGSALYKELGKWSGSCFAFSITGHAFFRKSLLLTDYQNPAPKIYDLKAPSSPSSPLTVLFEFFQISQYIRYFSDDIHDKNKNQGAALVQAIQDFENGNMAAGVALGLASPDRGGHAVLPYAVTPVIGAYNYEISIYDNNYPNGTDRKMYINTVTNAWQYEIKPGMVFGSAYTAQYGDYFGFVKAADVFDLVSSVPGIGLAGGSSGNLSVSGAGSMNIIVPSGATITDAAGHIIEDIEGAYEIVNITLTLADEEGPTKRMYALPNGHYSVMAGAGTNEAVFFNDSLALFATTDDPLAAIKGGLASSGGQVNIDSGAPHSFTITLTTNNAEPLTLTGEASGYFRAEVSGKGLICTGDAGFTATQGKQSRSYSTAANSQVLVYFDYDAPPSDYNFLAYLRPDKTNLRPGDAITVDVMLIGNINYTQFMADIAYDGALLEYTGYDNLGGFIAVCAPGGPGKVMLRSVPTTNMVLGAACAQPQRVVTLKFKVKDSSAAETTLSFSALHVNPPAGYLGTTIAPGETERLTINR